MQARWRRRWTRALPRSRASRTARPRRPRKGCTAERRRPLGEVGPPCLCAVGRAGSPPYPSPPGCSTAPAPLMWQGARLDGQGARVACGVRLAEAGHRATEWVVGAAQLDLSRGVVHDHRLARAALHAPILLRHTQLFREALRLGVVPKGLERAACGRDNGGALVTRETAERRADAADARLVRAELLGRARARARPRCVRAARCHRPRRRSHRAQRR